MKRILRWALGVIVVLLLLIALAVLGLLGTQGGSRWILQQVPGLIVSNYSGRLGGQWQADEIVWLQDATKAVVTRPAFNWSPGCLLKMTLCIKQLHVDSIVLELPPSTETSSEPFSLPDVQLPIDLQVEDVRIGALELNGAQQLKSLNLNAHWANQGLQIDSLEVLREDFSLNLTGHLQPSGNWPLTLSGDATLPAPDKQPWAVQIKVGGELLNSLNLDIASSGYLNAQLTGAVQALAEDLPLQAQIKADGFKASADLPNTLTLNQLVLDAKGDLKTGYTISGNAQLPGEEGPVALLLNALVDASGAQISTLRLEDEKKQHLQLSADLDWSDEFSADSKVEWDNFPWHSLYPAVDEPPVKLNKLSAEVSYSKEHYLGSLDAALNGPAGAFTVVTPFSGDLQQVFLPQLQVDAGQGSVSGGVKVGFANGVTWDAQLELKQFDPAFWVAELPGSLGGPVRTTGSFINYKLKLDSDIKITGRLRGQPALISAKAQGEGEQWRVNDIELGLGDNRIKGNGSLNKTLAGQLNLNLPKLGQLWPGLQGQVQGNVAVSGTLKAPQGKLKLDGKALAFQDNRVQSLQANARLDANQQAKIDLLLNKIMSGGNVIGDLAVAGSGDIKRQQATIDLKGPQLNTQIAADGTLNQGAWRGRLAKLGIQAGGQDWQLRAPASVERLADGKITLGEHCLVSQGASLCGDKQRLIPDTQLRYKLRNFPMDSLKPWLPDDFEWQGELSADINLDLPASGPKGKISIDAGQGVWKVRDNQQWVDFNYQRLRLDTDIGAKQISTRLDLQGPKIGQLNVQAAFDPRPGSRPLSGTFRLAGVDLSAARPFVPMVDQLQGQLNGSGSISGTLLKPLVNGQIQLKDGHIAGGQLPTNIEALQLQALINGESLTLSGDWRSGEAGSGKINGNLAWGGPLAGQVKLQGTRLPIAVEPFAEIEVEPDLTLVVGNEAMSIKGRVAVPRGKIEIREIPPSTVRVSEDARIVGAKEEAKQPVAIAMDIDVVVGEDKLTFKGFGLRANIAGKVHIGNDLDTRGVLDLKDGKFSKFGQKLTIRRARVLFAGPIDQPYIDVEAIREVDDVTAGIRLSGHAEQPTTEVFSEPAMSQSQALSYLLLGRPLGEEGDSNLVGQAVLALGLAGGSPMASNVASRLGISDFQLDSEGSGSNTSLVASGKLTDRLSLRYGVGVFEPVNTVALRYILTKRIYLEAASGLASSLDIFYTREF